MISALERVASQDVLPESTSVVVIGGGIVGVSAALTLAERNIPVVLIEKGQIAAEQSSRNLGWIRKTSRHAEDIPLSLAADKLWSEMQDRTGFDVGYKQAGVMFVTDSEKQMKNYQGWLDSVSELGIDSRLVSADEIDELVPGGEGKWCGGLYTPSDGYAEPHKATSLMAKAAINKGVTILQHCAVRGLVHTDGKVSGVVTEKGQIQCDKVLLAGGAWSRRFLKNEGISLPALQLVCSVFRTKAMEGPTDIAVGGPDFSFRKFEDGGYMMMQRGAIEAPMTIDHIKLGHRYLAQLRAQLKVMRISLDRFFMDDLKIARRWNNGSVSPFEIYRILEAIPNPKIIQEALDNSSNAWPVFKTAKIHEEWAGIIDVTPDSIPVIDHVTEIPGLTIATGFSGHGFGTGPAAGHLAADLVSGVTPIVDPAPYRFTRL